MNKIEKMFDKMIDYALERPEDAPSRVLIVSLSRETERILSPAKIELLKTILDKKPQTVGELVKALGRPKESVSRDLRMLQDYGLLSFAKMGRQKKPRVEKEVIAMPLTAQA